MKNKNSKAKANGKAVAKRRPGRPAIVWNFDAVEQLAAKGHQSATAICHCLGIHPDTLSHAVKDVKDEFYRALKKGSALWTDKLLDYTVDRIPKNDILLMFALKQQHGADWSDQRTVSMQGQIDVVYRDEVLPEPVEVTAERIDET